MQDLRNNIAPQHLLKQTVKVAELGGYTINDETVTEMLERMGVAPTPEMVQEAIGFLSAHSMEFNMSNLYDFFKSKQIMSRRDNRGQKRYSVKDLR